MGVNSLITGPPFKVSVNNCPAQGKLDKPLLAPPLTANYQLVGIAAYVIADVTEPKPNVFYELGIAEGFRKEIILIARKGTALPFDINDFPVVFWDSFGDFEDELEKRVSQIGASQGRFSCRCDDNISKQAAEDK